MTDTDTTTIDPAISAYMRGLSARAAVARRAMPAARRAEIARRAARARWAAVRRARRIERQERAAAVANELANDASGIEKGAQ